MENYDGYVRVNWNAGINTQKELTPLFEDKLVKILSEPIDVKKEFDLKNGDVLCLANPSNWEFQTYHESLKEYDGIFASKDLAKISRIAVCKNLLPGFDKFKRPIKANRSQIVVCDGEKLVALYKKGETWLSRSVALRAVEEIARIRGVECFKSPQIVELVLSARLNETKHIAWVFYATNGEKFYCLFNSGYVFSSKTNEVLSEQILEITVGKVISADFVGYVVPYGETGSAFSLYNTEDGTKSSSDVILF